MAKVTKYKNSKFATVLSFLGYVGMMFGIYALFRNEEVDTVVGVASLVIGFALKLLAAFISQKKSQKEKKQNEVV